MTEHEKQALYDYLAAFATEHKRELIEKIAGQRTRYVTVVLEDIYQPQNASATIRTCDSFGIQDLHIIENRNRFKVKAAVTQGASKWVDLHRYRTRESDNTTTCLQALAEQGYRLVATVPDPQRPAISDMPLDRKIALLFGTEETGLSSTALNNADMLVQIPMYGFSRSFNLSVSVALCLYDVTLRLRAAPIDWRLPPEELLDLKLRWIRKVIKKPEVHEARFRALRK